MREGLVHQSAGDLRSDLAEMQSLGEALGAITTHFTLEGALGVLLVDASRIGVIERQYGGEAQRMLRGPNRG